MIIDIIILILLALAVFIGKLRGLNSCIISILSLFLSVILATMLCRPLGYWIMDNTNIDDDIKIAIMNSIEVEKTEVKDLEKYPEPIKGYVEYATDGINSAKEVIRESSAKQLTTQIIFAIAFVLIIIFSKIILLIIKIVSKIIEKIPVLKQINDLGGAICGFIEGALLIYIFIAIISVCSPMIKDSWIVSEINQSYVGKAIYNNNILANNIIKFN